MERRIEEDEMGDESIESIVERMFGSDDEVEFDEFDESDEDGMGDEELFMKSKWMKKTN